MRSASPKTGKVRAASSTSRTRRRISATNCWPRPRTAAS
jgi:hypothetical protein